MTDTKENAFEPHQPEMIETGLRMAEAGLPPVPEPEKWDAAYGIDDAVAIAVVPERALVFWELASVIAAGHAETSTFRLIRLHLAGEIPRREDSWPIPAVGRFQDGGLAPAEQYMYVIARIDDDDEIPIMVTNPVRMPPRHLPGEETGLPGSIDLTRAGVELILKKGAR